MVTLFSHEFLNYFGPYSCAFSEIPFMSSNFDSKWSSRLDCFLIEGETGFLLEVKGSKSKKSLFESIDDDLARIYSKSLVSSFKEMTEKRGHLLPRRMYGLVLADMWQRDNKISDATSIDLWSYAKQSSDFPHIKRINTWQKPIGLYDEYHHYLIGGWTALLDFE